VNKILSLSLEKYCSLTSFCGGAENARPENDGQKNYGSGKCRTGK